MTYIYLSIWLAVNGAPVESIPAPTLDACMDVQSRLDPKFIGACREITCPKGTVVYQGLIDRTQLWCNKVK